MQGNKISLCVYVWHEHDTTHVDRGLSELGGVIEEMGGAAKIFAN